MNTFEFKQNNMNPDTRDLYDLEKDKYMNTNKPIAMGLDKERVLELSTIAGYEVLEMEDAAGHYNEKWWVEETKNGYEVFAGDGRTVISRGVAATRDRAIKLGEWLFSGGAHPNKGERKEG